MPGGDRTGPTGTGAGTGRARGYCAGFKPFTNDGGFAMRHRRAGRFHMAPATGGWQPSVVVAGRQGRGRRTFWPGPRGVTDDKETLKRRLHMLQSEIEAVNKQLDALE